MQGFVIGLKSKCEGRMKGEEKREIEQGIVEKRSTEGLGSKEIRLSVGRLGEKELKSE